MATQSKNRFFFFLHQKMKKLSKRSFLSLPCLVLSLCLRFSLCIFDSFQGVVGRRIFFPVVSKFYSLVMAVNSMYNKVICIFILFVLVMFIKLKSNGKLYDNFVWFEMGLPNTEKYAWNGSAFTKFGSPLPGYNFFYICTQLWVEE